MINLWPNNCWSLHVPSWSLHYWSIWDKTPLEFWILDDYGLRYNTPILCDEMINLWPNDCWSSRGPTWSLNPWPRRDERLWNREDPTTGGRETIPETLNPWIISLVTKWSICDQTTVGPCMDLLGLFIIDPYEIKHLWNFEDLTTEGWDIIPPSFVTKWPICDQTTVGLRADLLGL